MLCVHCSTPVGDEAKYCHSCGSMVSDAGGQAAANASMDQSAFAHLERMLREETAGEYVLGKMLGRGGMAVVYLAEETRLGRKVALKVLPPELTFGHGVDRFLREAKTAATLDHPGIIPIYRIASGGRLFWYAMKYLEGQSLEDVLRERGAYSLEESIELLEQVADALDYAHEHQVIHRDIKPANVMLDSRNRVIITDFGIAKAMSEGALTASGSIIGTPYFMSPEQGMGKPVAGAADQYSVAVMAFRMLAGHIPIDGDSAIDILHKHCMVEPPRLEDSAPHIPKHVCDAIDKALSKKPDDRFPNIRAFVKAMKDPSVRYVRSSARTEMMDAKDLEKKIAGSLPKITTRAAASEKGTAVDSASPVPGKSRSLTMTLVTAAVLLGGGVGAWQLLGGKEEATTTAQNTPSTNAPTATLTPPSAQEPPPTSPQVTPNSSPSTPPSTSPSTPPSAPRTGAPAPRPASPASPAGPATLRFVVSPGGMISIDGVSKGESTRFTGELAPGDHAVKVEKAGFVTKDTVVSLRAGQIAQFRLTLTPNP